MALPTSMTPAPRAQPATSTLGFRLLALAVLFGLELLGITIQFDTGDLPGQGALVRLVDEWGPASLRAIVAFAALFVTFGLLGARDEFGRISRELEGIPVALPLLAGHLCLLSAFGALSYLLFGHSPAGWPPDLLAGAWLACGSLAILAGAAAFVPVKLFVGLVGNTSPLWAVASIGGVAACLIGGAGTFLWRASSGLTFQVVLAILHPFVPDLTANPASKLLSTGSFYVTVGPFCSGLEGAGLMMVFSTLWLWVRRRDCRFPRAFLLIPAAVTVAWLANCVRIAALFLIGNGGAPAVALGGFHSQAGWIAFCAIALGVTLLLGGVPWLIRTPLEAAHDGAARENPTAWYLAPFLAVLATAMATRAASAGFEWLYPIRFFAAALVLWHYRRRYAKLDWRIDWAGPAAGLVVFLMWVGLSAGSGNASAVAPGLAALPAPARVTWIVFRTLAAALTVPLAEELAFRGYLLRRLVSANFETVAADRFTILPVLFSSAAFGLLHGSHWLPGTVAGALYAFAYRRRGRIGDAVAAHAVTNTCLAVCVLLTGNWGLW